MCIGNGFFDVEGMYGLGDFIYALGIADQRQASVINDKIASIIHTVQNGHNLQAMDEFNEFFGFFQYPPLVSPPYITQISNYTFYYNFLNTSRPEDYDYPNIYIDSTQSRRAIHVGNLTYHNQSDVQKYLGSDVVASSSRTKLVCVMENYRVLVYNGHLDMAVPYVSSERVLQNLTWKYDEEYKAADRKIWKLEDKVAGYVKCVRDFCFVLVRNAGHLVPHDQPQVAYDLITKFINNVSFT